MKKFFTVGKFAACSLGTTGIDFVLFTLLYAVFKERIPALAEILATVIARIVSSACNFYANHKLVFNSRGSMKSSLVRYYCLAVPQMLASAGLVTIINRLFANSHTLVTTLIKLLVDSTLFVISFFIQKKWVFKSE